MQNNSLSECQLLVPLYEGGWPLVQCYFFRYDVNKNVCMFNKIVLYIDSVRIVRFCGYSVVSYRMMLEIYIIAAESKVDTMYNSTVLPVGSLTPRYLKSLNSFLFHRLRFFRSHSA